MKPPKKCKYGGCSRKARPVNATSGNVAKAKHYNSAFGSRTPRVMAERDLGTRRERAETISDVVMRKKGYNKIYDDRPNPYKRKR